MNSKRSTTWSILAMAGALMLCGAPAVRAATVEVEVRERDGAAVRDLGVRIVPRAEAGSRWRFHPTVRTDARGLARFTDLEPGTYTFSFSTPADSDLLAPDDNPYVEAPVVTLPEPESEAAITVELWRAVPVVLDVASIDADLPTAKIVLKHVETGESFEHSMNRKSGSRKHIETSLVEGRWEAAIDLPPGYLVREIRVNREAIPGGIATIDTAADPQTQYVQWELSAPCELYGRLLPAGAPPVQGVTVAATMIEPGPWLESEATRGRRHDRVEPQRWEPHHEFHIRLPEGLWRIAPEGPSFESSEPPYLDVRLEPGEVRRQDFTVKMLDPDEARTTLRVRVRTPDGNGVVNDAVVELYRAGEVEGGDPIRSERTPGFGESRTRQGRVEFRGLPAGSYEIVAGHADWLDGRTGVEFDPEENDGHQSTEVRLRDGARVQAFAFDHDYDEPFPGVEVELERVGEPFPSVLHDDALSEERRVRRTRTDTTGYATVTGLAEGTYRLKASVTGALRMERFVKVRMPGSGERDTVDLDVTPDRLYEVELPVYLGASIAGSIVCDDRGPLPPMASFAAYRDNDSWAGIELGPGGPTTDLIDEPAAGGEPEPVLDRERVLLQGRNQDEFTIGPFRGGAYVVAIRPEGYDAWAWVYGTDLRVEAATVQLPAGEATGVGTVEALCRPAVVVSPRVISGHPLPDMRVGDYRVEATRRRDTGEEVAVYPTAEPRRGHVLIRDLQEGSTDVRLEIEHPWLIPPRVVFEARALDLERGVREYETVTFRDVGGALAVTTGAPAVRVVAGDQVVAVAESIDGAASVNGILPGTYVVEACRDPACRDVAGPTATVDVEPARTRQIELR